MQKNVQELTEAVYGLKTRSHDAVPSVEDICGAIFPNLVNSIRQEVAQPLVLEAKQELEHVIAHNRGAFLNTLMTKVELASEATSYIASRLGKTAEKGA